MSERIVLARRASGREHAVVFDDTCLRVEGGFSLRRAVAYRSMDGLERKGWWLWLGAGLLAVGLGGRDVPPERLDAVEVALRERIAALPGGLERLVLIDGRHRSMRRPPLLTAAALLAWGLLEVPGSTSLWSTISALLLALAFGVIAEGWLGRRPALVSGAAGALAGGTLGLVLGFEAPGALLLAAGWIGLLGFARVFRGRELSVLTRGAIDLAGILSLGFAAVAVSEGSSGLLVAMAAAAGFAFAPFGLRREQQR